LRELLNVRMDLLLVVGGYNSSNTSTSRDGRREVTDIFCAERFAALFRFGNQALHLHEKREVVSHFWLPNGPPVIGITAGASCPNNLIEKRLFGFLNYAASRVEISSWQPDLTTVAALCSAEATSRPY